MGLLSVDLERHRAGIRKMASIEKADLIALPKPGILDLLKTCLEQYVGAEQTLEKAAIEDDHKYLFKLHEAVEASYRNAVKIGKRPEADKMLEKFAGWKYLKGQPGEVGDFHPFPAPDEK